MTKTIATQAAQMSADQVLVLLEEMELAKEMAKEIKATKGRVKAAMLKAGIETLVVDGVDVFTLQTRVRRGALDKAEIAEELGLDDLSLYEGSPVKVVALNVVKGAKEKLSSDFSVAMTEVA